MGIRERGSGEQGRGKEGKLRFKEAFALRDALLADKQHHVLDRLGLPAEGPDRALGLQVLQAELSKGQIRRTDRSIPDTPLIEGRAASVIDRLRQAANQPDTAALDKAEQQIAALRERYPEGSDRPHQIGLAIHALVANNSRTEGITGRTFVPNEEFLETWGAQWRAILGGDVPKETKE